MERCNSLYSTSKVCLSLLVFSLIADNITAISENLDSPVTEDLVCKNISCGQGKCVASSSTITGYECQCFDGWKQIEGGLFPTSCLIPNCSLDFKCGGNAPPLPLAFPGLNFSSPCNLVWCNNGECVANGTGHNCQCHAGNENFLDNPAFACFPQCAFGAADCKEVGLIPPSAPGTNAGSSNTGKVPQSSSTDLGSHNTGAGSNNGEKSLWKIQAFTTIILSAILHAWI